MFNKFDSRNKAFLNCHFYAGDGARILNNTGKSMNFSGCTFESCDKLWQGIEMQNGGLLRLTNCSLKDAYYAIWQRSPVLMILNDVLFDDNYIGVRYGSFGQDPITHLQFQSSVPGQYNHVKFHSSNGLKQAYPGLIPYPTLPGAQTYAGIYSQFLANLDLYNDVEFGDPAGGGTNFLNCGIYFAFGSLNIHHTAAAPWYGVRFGNIVREPFYGPGPGSYSPDGAAVYVLGNPIDFPGIFSFTGLVNTGAVNNTSFTNCDYAIYSALMFNNVISVTDMQNVGRGVIIYQGYGTINVGQNFIHASRRGIELRNCAATMSPPAPGQQYVINVNQNTIYLGDNPSTVSNYAKGIYLNEPAGNTYNSNALLELNDIAISYGLDGVHLLNVNACDISFGGVGINGLLPPYPPYTYGYRVENCFDIKNSCTSVWCTTPAMNTTVKRWGYMTKSTQNDSIICTTAGYLWRGYEFRNNCINTVWMGNNIDVMGDAGLYLNKTAVTGVQLLSINGSPYCNGNTWIDPENPGFMPPGRSGVNSNTQGYLASRIYVDDANMIAAQGIPYYTYPNYNLQSNTTPPQGQWFLNATNTPTFECGLSCSIQQDGPQRLSIDSLIAVDSTLTSEFIPENRRSLRQYLYDKLDNDSSLVDSSLLFQQFYDAAAASNLSAFAIAKKQYGCLFQPDGQTFQTTSLRMEIYNRLDLLRNHDSLFQSGSLSLQDSLDMLEQDTLIRHQCDSLVNEYRQLQHQQRISLLSKADSLRQFVLNIQPQDIVESNLKTVYSLQLSITGFAQPVLSAEQKTTLFNISSQCADMGGPGVYMARGIYAMIEPEVEFIDDSACLAQGIFRYTETTAEGSCLVSLLPNPAQDVVKLNYSSSENATFLLHDLNGKTLMSFPVLIESGEVLIPLLKISDGFYLWEFRSDRFTRKGKLVISR